MSEQSTAAVARVGHAIGIRIRRLDPQYRYEWQCRVAALIEKGAHENDAKATASAEIVEAYGERAYRNEEIGIVSGGHFWQRWGASLRIHISNLRARLANRRETL